MQTSVKSMKVFCSRRNDGFLSNQHLRYHLERKQKALCIDVNNVSVVEALEKIPKQMVRKTSDTLKCYVCTKSFPSVSNLNKHLSKCDNKKTEYNEITQMEESDLLQNMEDIQSDVRDRLVVALDSHDREVMNVFMEDCSKVKHRIGKYMENFGEQSKIIETIEVLTQAIMELQKAE